MDLRYLTVDYERHNFSVSQCDWSSFKEQDIRPIISPNHSTHRHNNTPLSGAEISGIVVGCVVLLILAWLLAIRKRLKHFLYLDQILDGNREELDTIEVRIKDNGTHLLDGEPYHGPELDTRSVQEVEGGDEWQHELAAGCADAELPASPAASELPSMPPKPMICW